MGRRAATTARGGARASANGARQSGSTLHSCQNSIASPSSYQLLVDKTWSRERAITPVQDRRLIYTIDQPPDAIARCAVCSPSHLHQMNGMIINQTQVI